MHSDYIDVRNGGHYVARTRISLDSIVSSFNGGQSPEAILEDRWKKRILGFGAIFSARRKKLTTLFGAISAIESSISGG